MLMKKKWFLNWLFQNICHTSLVKIMVCHLPFLYALTLDDFLCLNCRLNVFCSSLDTMSTISPTDFDSLEIQQQYNDINNRWDLAAETDWDNENSSARLFERSRIKALAGKLHFRNHQVHALRMSSCTYVQCSCVTTNIWFLFLKHSAFVTVWNMVQHKWGSSNDLHSHFQFTNDTVFKYLTILQVWKEFCLTCFSSYHSEPYILYIDWVHNSQKNYFWEY